MWAQLGKEVQPSPFDAFIPYLKELGADLQVRFFRSVSLIPTGSALPQAVQNVLIGDKTTRKVVVAEVIGLSHIITARLPIADLEAIKNPTEIKDEDCRASHIRDDAALVRYLRGWGSN